MKRATFILTLACIAAIGTANATSTFTPSNHNYEEVNVTFKINPFCMAIAKGDIETVKRLIEFGEDVNKKSNGMTPAMYAARYNHCDILKLLIKNGADLKTKSKQGYKAMDYAEASGAKEAMEVLEKALG